MNLNGKIVTCGRSCSRFFLRYDAPSPGSAGVQTTRAAISIHLSKKTLPTAAPQRVS